MNFGFEQRWTATVAEVLDLYTDEEFWSSVSGFSRTTPPEVIEVRRDGDSAFTALRWKLNVDLPSQATRFIDPDNVAWVENTTWNLTSRTASVEFVPAQGASLMSASANVEVYAEQEEAVRRVTGSLKVRIPLLGGKVERAVVDGVEEHLDEEAEVIATALEA